MSPAKSANVTISLVTDIITQGKRRDFNKTPPCPGGVYSEQSCGPAFLSGHALALFGALHASFGAFLAVTHLMLRAFLATVATYLGTKATHLFRILASTAHQDCRHRTDVRTVTVKLDASSHHLYIVLS
jgi:hypothetical protein|tara:strand:+ start:914 stop:1300 length:387 start_codon:yes stop_codon:yes gene_type:complete